MEASDPTIPPLRSMMMMREEGIGTHRWEKFFYLAPMMAFATLSGLLMTVRGRAVFDDDGWTSPIGWILLVVQVGFVAWVLVKQRATGLREGAALFRDEHFISLFDGGFAEVISRYDGASEDAGRSPEPGEPLGTGRGLG